MQIGASSSGFVYPRGHQLTKLLGDRHIKYLDTCWNKLTEAILTSTQNMHLGRNRDIYPYIIFTSDSYYCH